MGYYWSWKKQSFIRIRKNNDAWFKRRLWARWWKIRLDNRINQIRKLWNCSLRHEESNYKHELASIKKVNIYKYYILELFNIIFKIIIIFKDSKLCLEELQKVFQKIGKLKKKNSLKLNFKNANRKLF